MNPRIIIIGGVALALLLGFVFAINRYLYGFTTLEVVHTAAEGMEPWGLDSIISTYDEDQLITVGHGKTPPKLHFKLRARSSGGIVALGYKIERCVDVECKEDNRNLVESSGLIPCPSSVAENGRILWPETCELSRRDNKPLVIDLAGTDLDKHLKLTSLAFPSSGGARSIEATYFWIDTVGGWNFGPL